MTNESDYSAEDIVASLRSVGVKSGDVIFCHVSVGRLGRPEGECTTLAVARLLCGALREAVGANGTVLMPTYSYSIGRTEIFDPASTPTTIGPIPEYFRQLPGAIRSADPMLAVSGLGPEAASLLSDLPWTCYGADSLYDRLKKRRARICTIGLPLHWATYRHHIEEMARVPFRFSKLFTGDVMVAGKPVRQTWSYFAAIRQDGCSPDGTRLQAMLRASGDCHVAPLGRSEVWGIDAAIYFERGIEALREDPWLTARGPVKSQAELIALEDKRVGASLPSIPLTPDADCREILEALTPLPRDLVSSGFEASLDAIAKLIPLTIQHYPSGEPCFEWVVPEKWTCREAWLEKLDGTRLIDYRDSPLHVMSYSQPFEGEISREELLPHLYTHATIPDAVPFVYSYFVRRWGLCCSQRLKKSLTDERYRVRISSDTSFGAMQTGEAVVAGEIPEEFVLCAHLDHPGQANDGLSGVAAGVEIMRRLRLKKLRHSVRLVIVCETFGSLAWLSHRSPDAPTMKAGIFLEMLGLDYPLAVQRSSRGNSRWDEVAVRTVRNRESDAWDAPFLHVVTNDDRQFNAPGIRVPMISLSRVKDGARSGHNVFPEYHTDQDDVAGMDFQRLENSIDAVLEILQRWDEEVTPIPRYRGEPCLTRVGLGIDFVTHPELGAQTYDVMHAIDGRLTLMEIAAQTNLPPQIVETMVEKLRVSGLVALA